jgi:predicted GNAT family N-acyltransferase
MAELTIAFGATEDLVQDALAVRRTVFIEGQGVSEDRELDGLDNGAEHYVGYLGSIPVAVARTRAIYLGTDDHGSHDVKIERVGVLSEHRGEGFGGQIMRFILDQLPGNPTVRNAILESQTHALGFYEDMGFIPTGRIFQDAGMPHRKMYLPVHTEELYKGQSFTGSKK